ncbi:MAG: DUF3618 domain-containing protein [Lautropia sp.]
MKTIETDGAGEPAGTTAERERDIDRTRERIVRHVDEIGQRLSPGQLVDQALGYLKDHGESLASRTAAGVRASPLPLLTVGVGLLWLLKSSSERTREPPASRSRSGNTADDDPSWADSARSAGRRITDQAAAMGDDLTGKLADAKDTVSSRLSSMTGAASSKLTAATDSAQSTVRTGVDQVRERTSHARDQLTTLMSEQPLVMGAIGVALGSTIGSLLPSTRAESEVLGAFGESLARSTRQMATEGYDTLREEAHRSVDELSSRLANRGNDASQAT